MRVKIRSIAKHHPQHRISSEEIDWRAGLKTGSTERSTGVRFRYHAAEDESVSQLAAAALRQSLAESQRTPADIDLLIFAGASFDYPVPHTAVLIKSLLTDDSADFPCLDLDATCLSFLHALDVAHLYLQSGRYQTVAVACAEIASRSIRPADHQEYGLFGDAAVAIILEASANTGYSPSFSRFVNYPSGAKYAFLGIGGAVNRGMLASADDPGYYFRMEGKKLIRLTIRELDAFVQHLEEHTQCRLRDFERIITHQTSKFGNEYLIKQFGLDRDKVEETLTHYGNCVSASLALGLEQFHHQCRNAEHHRVLLLGAAAGVSIGAMVLEF